MADAEIHGSFVIAAVNSAQGFLSRALAVKTREQALESLSGAEQWIAKARAALETGELPDGFGAPELRPAGPTLPLERLDGKDGGA